MIMLLTHGTGALEAGVVQGVHRSTDGVAASSPRRADEPWPAAPVPPEVPAPPGVLEVPALPVLPVARRGNSVTAATAIDAAPRPAPAAQASWYPLVSACADVPLPVRQVARGVSSATPSAPPTCCAVLNTPEMTPASASVA